MLVTIEEKYFLDMASFCESAMTKYPQKHVPQIL